jgi:hypothetical protein
MKKRIIIPAVLALAMVFAPGVLAAKGDLEGKELYIQSNIWFENPMKINAINFHKGTILRAGTKVRIDKMTSRALKFVTLKNGLEYKILFSRKYFPGTKIDEYASWYFGPKNPLKSSVYKGFSAVEKKGIKEGAVKKGMSKKAVLMAYGYPPQHRTRSIDLDTCSYWNNRIFRMEVRFDNNDRVAQIIGGGH